MKNNKIIMTAIVLGVSMSLFAGCSTQKVDQKTQIVEKPVAIDYTGNPEQILSSYTDEGLTAFKARFPEQNRMNYAVKQIGKVAPDFELTNIKGDVVKLSNLKGKKILLDVVKSTCPACKKTTPMLVKYAKDNKDVVVIPIFPKDAKAEVEAYYKELNLEVDTNAIAGVDNGSKMTLIKDYELKLIPTLVFIDETGRISYAVEGDFDETILNDYHKTAFGDTKLYDLVKKNKVEVDKDGKVIKTIENSSAPTSEKKGEETKDQTAVSSTPAPATENKTDK